MVLELGLRDIGTFLEDIGREDFLLKVLDKGGTFLMVFLEGENWRNF